MEKDKATKYYDKQQEAKKFYLLFRNEKYEGLWATLRDLLNDLSQNQKVPSYWTLVRRKIDGNRYEFVDKKTGDKFKVLIDKVKKEKGHSPMDYIPLAIS